MRSIQPSTFPVFWRDPRDPVAVPDVGVNLAFDNIPTHSVGDLASAVGDAENAGHAKGARVQEPEPGGPVAHDQRLSVRRSVPSLRLGSESSAMAGMFSGHRRKPTPLVRNLVDVTPTTVIPSPNNTIIELKRGLEVLSGFLNPHAEFWIHRTFPCLRRDYRRRQKLTLG